LDPGAIDVVLGQFLQGLHSTMNKAQWRQHLCHEYSHGKHALTQSSLFIEELQLSNAIAIVILSRILQAGRYLGLPG
jgi:hypothetical protein